MPRFILPDATSIQKTFAMLFGEGVEVGSESGTPIEDRHVATYVQDDNKLAALCACDDRFVAYAGAALTMVPSNVVGEMIASQQLSDIILANFHEVMNILSRLLMSDHTPHLRLDRTLQPEAARTTVAELNASVSARHFKVGVPRYGSGSLTIMVS